MMEEIKCEVNADVSLRDYFAGQALMGLMSSQWHGNSPDYESCAKLSYEVADEMLKARDIEN